MKTKIAVTYENGEVFQHFGHTKEFKFYTVEAAHSGQVQRPFSEETVPASAATVNAVSANEKRYTEDGQMQQTVQTVAKVGQANANQADEMRTQQPGARMEDTAGSRFKQEDTGEKLEPTKEARIREILEEFLA